MSKIKIMRNSLFAGLLAGTAFGAGAAPIDLSGWNELTLDFSDGQSAGNWVLEPGNTAVTQTLNADPSFFLNGLNQTQYSIDGSWQVNEQGGDDDYMGFVFGYQNSSNFYLFDWKQGTQPYEGGNAAAGMTIKKFEGGTGNGLADLSLLEMWENENNIGDMTVLATNHGAGLGWADTVLYDFHLDFNVSNPGDIHIVVNQGATELWNTTINDLTFASGQFGFYNYSQQNVRYAGFEQTGGVIISASEPGALILLGLGIAALPLVRRRKFAAALQA